MSGETKQKQSILDSMESGNEKINAVIKTTNATFKWLDYVNKFITKNGIKRIFTSLFVVFSVVIGGIWLFDPGIFVDRIEKYKEEKHEERAEIRTTNTPLVQEELDRFRKQFNVSWAAVWELHNSTNNLDGLPFLFASLTYESMHPGLVPIASQFDEVRLSLHPLSTYLKENEIWCGNVEELQELDPASYYRAKALNIEYLGFKVITVNGAPKLLLSVAFVEGCDVPNFEKLKESCVYTSYKIGGLLAVSKENTKAVRKRRSSN